ncbi:MAG: hypothetical protein GY810_14420 [Aureispira sp.]|nr:hypothetical protein [Aureispira sp.]
MEKTTIDLELLKDLLIPIGYELDTSQDHPFLWKHIKQNDTRSPYAFSLVMATIDNYTMRLEGLNEPRLRKAIRAGIIKVESQDDVEALKEVVFESTLDSPSRLKTILPFFEKQLAVIGSEPIHTKEYKKALDNIELLVDAANAIEM